MDQRGELGMGPPVAFCEQSPVSMSRGQPTCHLFPSLATAGSDRANGGIVSVKSVNLLGRRRRPSGRLTTAACGLEIERHFERRRSLA